MGGVSLVAEVGSLFGGQSLRSSSSSRGASGTQRTVRANADCLVELVATRKVQEEAGGDLLASTTHNNILNYHV